MARKQKKAAGALSYEEFDRRRAAELNGSFIVRMDSGWTDEQIDSLRQIVNEDHDKGTLSSVTHADDLTTALKNEDRMEKVRRSRIHWLDEQRYKWVYDRAWALAREANAKYRFQIKPIRERIQLSIYDASEQGFYTWHTDTSVNNMSRKISMSIPLSCPSEYRGGELQFMVAGEGSAVAQPQGGVICFPSIEMHRVTPVTEGRRYSLVIWVGGPPWS